MLLSLIPYWQLSLSVLAAVMAFVFGGIVVSCYRGRSRLGALLFTLAVIYGAVWADKTGHALYFGPHTEVMSAAMSDSPSLGSFMQEGPMLLVSGIGVSTSGTVSVSSDWSTNAVPPYTRLELQHTPDLLDPFWITDEVYETVFGVTNHTFVIRPSGAEVPEKGFWRLYADCLRIDFGGIPSIPLPEGRMLHITTELTVSVDVRRSVRPDDSMPPDPAFADDPFSGCEGLAFDSTNSVLTASGPGTFDLPDGNRLLVLSPSFTYGEPHSFAGDEGLVVRSEDGDVVYSRRTSYPLDTECLWTGWHTGTNTSWGCSCTPVFEYGTDVSRYPALTCDISREGDVATAVVRANGRIILETNAVHRVYGERGGTSCELSGAGDCCSDGCSDGDCSVYDGPSLGSVRFRIALGAPARGMVSGFLYFDREDVFTPGVGSFTLLARRDAMVSDSIGGSVRTVSCLDNGGRTLRISGIADGVDISVEDTETGTPDGGWRIVREGAGLRFVKRNRIGETLSDRTYASDGGWRVIDNVTGLVERKTLSREDFTDGFVETDERIAACGSVTGVHTRVTSHAFLSCGTLIVREVERCERVGTNAWNVSFAEYWADGGTRRDGMPRLVFGDDRGWVWRDYDDLGRETLRFEQRNGSSAPDGWPHYTLEDFPRGIEAFATESSYDPLPGDSARTNDRDRVRTESRYAVGADGPVLIGRTWRILRAGMSGGYPTLETTTVRACSRTATVDDPGNAVSVLTSYADAPSVPYLLRGECVSFTDEDGVTTSYDRRESAGILRTVERREKNGTEAKVRRITERDLAYGNVLYESTGLTSDPPVEFGWSRRAYDGKNRLRSIRYDDGSSETNDYSCCRLLSRTARDGAKTVYSTTTPMRELYSAEEEVWLKGLMERAAPFPPEGWRNGYVGYINCYRVTQRYRDAFGTETNTVVRGCRYEHSATNANYSLDNWFVSSSRRFRPEGFKGRLVEISARGAATETVSRETASARIVEVVEKPTAESDECLRRTVMFETRGGGSCRRGEHDGTWTESRSFDEYLPDGTRTAYSVTAGPDIGTVTNAVTRYDFLGRVSVTETPTSRTTVLYEGPSWNPLSETDEMSGVVVTNLYDGLGEPLGSVCGGIESVRETDYVEMSNAWWRVERTVSRSGDLTGVVSETWTRLTGLSDECRFETFTLEDGARVGSKQASFDASTLALTTVEHSVDAGTRTVRSKFGRTLSGEGPAGRFVNHYDPYGNVFFVERTSGSGSLQRSSYAIHDALGCTYSRGRFWTQTEAWLDEEEFDPFGRVVARSDELGSRVERTLDAEGRILAESGDACPVRMAYDSQGRRTQLGTSRFPDTGVFETTTWAYDARTGFCTSKTYADGTSEVRTQTADGLPLRTTRADGGWTERAYGAERRLTALLSSDPSCGYGIVRDSLGRIVSVSNAVARYEYGLSRRGTVTNETVVTSSGVRTIVREEDAFGRTVALSADGHAGWRLTHSDTGAIVGVSNAFFRAEYARDANGAVTNRMIVLADGAPFSQRFLRGNVRRPELVTAIVNSSPLETNRINCVYDVLSRPITNGVLSVSYNRRGEVSQARIDGLVDETDEYDGIGNVQSVAQRWRADDYMTDSVNALSRVDTWIGGVTETVVTNSPNGEMTGFGTRAFGYDALSRLVSVSDGEDAILTLSYAYDHLDRRILRTAPGEVTEFVFDGYLPILETTVRTVGGASVTNRTEYYWGPDLSDTLHGAAGVGGLLCVRRDGETFIPFGDAHGNVTGYWNARGEEVARYVYDAFGRTVSESGTRAGEFRIRHATRCLDPEAGLYIYPKRVYSPDLRRWLTRDPLGEDGGPNLYSFCRNGATYSHDPMGEFPVQVVTTYPTGFFEYLFTGNKSKEGDVHDAQDIRISENLSSSSTVWGKFTGAWTGSVNFGACGVGINLGISLRDDLRQNVSKNVEIKYKEHYAKFRTYPVAGGTTSMSDGKPPPKSLIVAHEQAHAEFYLNTVVAAFKRDVAGFSSGKVSTEDIELMKRIYMRTLYSHIAEDARFTNEATRKWLIGSGYKYRIEEAK